MGIGTSDGKYYDSEFDLAKDNFLSSNKEETAQALPEVPEMSAEDTKAVWEDSARLSEKYPYEPTNKEEIDRQLKDVGAGLFRKALPHTQEYLKNLPSSYDAYEMNNQFMQEGLSDAQREWFDQKGRIIYIKRKPLVSEVDKNTSTFGDLVHETVGKISKFMGFKTPEEVQQMTLKQHLGDFLNTAMSVLPPGFRAPGMPKPLPNFKWPKNLPGSTTGTFDFKAPEQVLGASLEFKNGEVYVGNSHLDVLEHAAKTIPDPEVNIAREGFVTTRGRQISREDALKLASRRDQLIEPDTASEKLGRLFSEDLQTDYKIGKIPEPVAAPKGPSDYPHVQKEFLDLVNQGKTKYQIANEMNASPLTVENLAKKTGVDLKSLKVPTWTEEKLSEARRMVSEGSNYKDIGAKLGLNETTVGNRLNAEGFTNPIRSQIAERWKPENIDKIVKSLQEGKSVPQIAKDLGIERTTLSNKITAMKLREVAAQNNLQKSLGIPETTGTVQAGWEGIPDEPFNKITMENTGVTFMEPQAKPPKANNMNKQSGMIDQPGLDEAMAVMWENLRRQNTPGTYEYAQVKQRNKFKVVPKE